MRIFLISLLTVFIFSACNARQGIRAELEKNTRAYNELLRWHEFNKAGLFAVEAISEEFRARAGAAKDVRVVEYRILNVILDEKKGEAAVEVEIDYYLLASGSVKTVVDNQKWSYVEEKGKRQWRLTSAFPEFR
ncbi:MAG: hypothetical protein AB1632_13495 [Nitrospirota bacterium]